MKPLARIHAPIFALMVSMSLCGCQLAPNPSGNFQVTETSVGPSGRELETIRLNNCDGKADTTQVVERGQTVQIEGGAQLGVSIEVIQAAVTGKYSKGFSYKKSQMLTAPPRTNMEFTLEWTMEDRVGTVARDGQTTAKAGYRYIIPTYVQIRSQKDLGCAGSSQPTLPAPSASKVTPPIQPLTATPLPTRTPLPAPTLPVDTPPGTILEVGQTWRQGGLELQLTKAVIHIAHEGNSNIDRTGLLVTFVLRSNRAQDISLKYTFDTIASAVDNQNHPLTLRCTDMAMTESGQRVLWYNCPTQQFVLKANTTIDLPLSLSDSALGFIMVDTNNPSVNQIVITVSGLSSINGARWRVPISH